MVVEVKINCPSDGEVVFSTALHPFEISEEVACPVCGTTCTVLEKGYVQRSDLYVHVTTPAKEVVEYGETAEPAPNKGKRARRV